MIAYKKYFTIQDPNHLVLSDLPFKAGQRVEVLVIPEEPELRDQTRELESLFKATQKLPQAQSLSESEIAAEVSAYRAGK